MPYAQWHTPPQRERADGDAAEGSSGQSVRLSQRGDEAARAAAPIGGASPGKHLALLRERSSDVLAARNIGETATCVERAQVARLEHVRLGASRRPGEGWMAQLAVHVSTPCESAARSADSNGVVAPAHHPQHVLLFRL